MDLGILNMAIELPSAEMWLAKADKTILGKITQRSGIAFSHYGKRKKLITHTQLIKLGSLGELDFSIPYQIEINHVNVRNPIIDLVNESSLIKCIFNGDETWFVIIDIKKTMDDNKDIMELTCRSSNYELMRRYVRGFNVVSNNLSSLCQGGNTINGNGDIVAFSGILSGTLWGISADTDATFDTIFRSFNFTKATVLDALLQICQSFNAVPIFDTVNRKIKFQQIQNVGIDMGGKVSYGNFMRTLENESNTDLLITRFVPYGKGGLTINAINGVNYIDDFSFFLKGYTQDISGNVLTSSPHMSDSLAKALTNYIALQASHSGDFSTLLTTLTSQEVILTTKQNDMDILTTALKSLEAQLDVAQTTGSPTATILSNIASQNTLIATKQTEINTANTNIATTNASIAALQATLLIDNSLSQANQMELIPFIREQEWTDNSISDSTDLYNQALVQFEKYKTPQITIKLSMVNIWEDIKSQFLWEKFKVGNDITVEYNVLGSSVKAKIIELSFDHQGGDVQITLANWSDVIRQNEAISKMIFQGISANNTLSANIDSWGQIDKAAKDINNIYNNGIAASTIAISAAVNNSVTIDNRGITITDSTDASRYVRMTNGVIGLTKGGIFTTAITPDGILAPSITGQLGSFVTLNAASITTGTLSSVNIAIGTGNSIFKVDPLLGFWAGNASYSSAPFKCDMLGNVTANAITVNSPTINNGTITGSSINIGSGNFVVTSGGALTANSASITGAINSGSTVTGATIRTSSGNARMQLDTGFLTQYDSSNNVVLQVGTSGTPFLQLKVNSGTYSGATGVLSVDSSGFYITSAGGSTHMPMTLAAGIQNVNINGANVMINGQNFGSLVGVVSGHTTSINSINTSISSLSSLKADIGSSTSSVSIADTHNHGIPNGTVLSTPTGTVTFVSFSGSAAHSHAQA